MLLSARAGEDDAKRKIADYTTLVSRLVVDDQRSCFATMHADNMTPKMEKKKRIREARELTVTIESLFRSVSSLSKGSKKHA